MPCLWSDKTFPVLVQSHQLSSYYVICLLGVTNIFHDRFTTIRKNNNTKCKNIFKVHCLLSILVIRSWLYLQDYIDGNYWKRLLNYMDYLKFQLSTACASQAFYIQTSLKLRDLAFVTVLAR